jgi:hypothetical protein
MQADDLTAHTVIHSCERLDPGDSGNRTNGLITTDTNVMTCDEGFIHSGNPTSDDRSIFGVLGRSARSAAKTVLDLCALEKRSEDDSNGAEFSGTDNKTDVKESFVNTVSTECVWPSVVKEENLDLSFDDRYVDVKPQTDWKLLVAPFVELVRIDTRKKLKCSEM